MKHKKRRQMSESWPTVALLTFSGGLQDAYSYCMHGKVFANAQTGNIVLMSQCAFYGDLKGVLHYLVPLTAFIFGVFVTEQIRARYQTLQTVHWRQLVLLGEIFLLFLAGLFPSSSDLLANALVSFACAMQVQAFRKVNGYAYASTMCIGNLRSGIEALSAYLRTQDRTLLKKFFHYFGVIGLFALGAGSGAVFGVWLGLHTIWICCVLLAVGFALMFVKEEMEENPEIQAAWAKIQSDAQSAETQAKVIGQTLGREIHQQACDLRHPEQK